jgi:2,3-bisphosphoglycerate-dependent phosphoglycerate mutase
MIQKTLYVIRHCQATGQEPSAPLTPEGERQAIELAAVLASFPIERILSSPYERAISSIAPLAQRLSLPILTDDRLVERTLSTGALEDWVTALRATFDDPELRFPGGESSRAATARAVAAIEAALGHGAQTSAIVTHGNLMSLLLRHFDPTIGFAFWQRLKNPDVYAVEVGPGIASVRRITGDAG